MRNAQSTRQYGGPTQNFAFIVEAMVIMGFLAAALALFVSLFGVASNTALRSTQLTNAVTMARNCAESFAADPLEVPQVTEAEGLTAICTTSTTQDADVSGTMYHLYVSVQDEGGNEVYVLSTSRWVGDA